MTYSGENGVISISHVTKHFGNTIAVDDVTLSFRAGQVLAIVGENGAGKTTLMRILAGETKPDRGQLFIDGHPVSLHDVAQARAYGISMVHQELSLLPYLSVAENIALGNEPTSRIGVIKSNDLRGRTLATLRQIGADIDADSSAENLSTAEQQLVEIAKALYTDPRILILDEPTSSLEHNQVELLNHAVMIAKQKGAAIVFVSHRIEEVLSFADLICVMRDGHIVDIGPRESYTDEMLITKMVGRQVTHLFSASHRPLDLGSDNVLQIVNGETRGAHELNIAIPKGAIIGVGGLEGQGQHELAELCAGVLQLRQGLLLFQGAPTNWHSPGDALRDGVAYLPPDRRTSGLFLPLSIVENISISVLDIVSGLFAIHKREEISRVEEIAHRLNLRYGSLQQSVSELSGGNQQKVLFGRWIIYPSLKLLVLDDPTRGVDIGARAEIYSLLEELANQGISILLITTDMVELLGLSDAIYVMYESKVTGKLLRSEATEERIMQLATGRSQTIEDGESEKG